MVSLAVPTSCGTLAADERGVYPANYVRLEMSERECVVKWCIHASCRTLSYPVNVHEPLQ